MKKIIISLLVVLLISPLLISCTRPDPDDNIPKELEYTQIAQQTQSTPVAAGETVPLVVDAEIGQANYLKMEVTSDVNLTGYIKMHSTSDNTDVSQDQFFIPMDSEEPFKHILDYYSYLESADKTIAEITFTNVSSAAGSFTVTDVSVALRDLPQDMEEKQVYIGGGGLELGVSLANGGAVNSLKKTSGRLVQARDTETGIMSVGENYDKLPGRELASTSVNLLNRHDAGRLVQQSYYGYTSGTNDTLYQSGTFMGNKWPYNPVQGGNQENRLSKLVDFELTETSLYIKCIPADWAIFESNPPTEKYLSKSYMENWYSFEDGMVKVCNRFTDFSGLPHTLREQELPAFYGIAPLGRFTTYSGNSPYTGAPLSKWDDLSFWSGGGIKLTNVKENWVAWVNTDDFGVGLYVPNVETVLAGRYMMGSDEALKFDGDASKTNATTYAAMLGRFKLRSYDSFEYSYYLSVDYVFRMRDEFNRLSETITNPKILEYENRTA